MNYNADPLNATTFANVSAITELYHDVPLPTDLWTNQEARYREYWDWFSGAVLEEEVGTTSDGEVIYRYPLRIGIRNIARKHVSLLFGEVPDSPSVLAKTLVTPVAPIESIDIMDEGARPMDEKTEYQFDENHKLAMMVQNIVNQVWMQSKGRSIQQENALLSQFLGGCVYQVRFVPERKDYQIPIQIHAIHANKFYPIWDEEDPYELHEAFIVYKLPAKTAYWKYGVKPAGLFSVYIEHWTKKTFSIYIDGQPVVYRGVPQKNLPNPFGIVPFVYIPHVREGDFYGSSHIDDIAGLIKEFNLRMSDMGIGIKRTIERKRFITNSTNRGPQKVTLPDGASAIDLGTAPPGADPPDIKWEDPPDYSPTFMQFLDALWIQINREASLNSVAWGEDEGSQRSALTLAFRMWPSTAHARMERTHYNDGNHQLFKIILRMLIVKGFEVPNFGKIPESAIRDLQSYIDWQPQIPRDRESQLNEIILRKQANLMSTRKAITDFGDVRNIDREIEQIREDMEFQAEMMAAPTGEEGAPQDLEEPVVKSGIND